MSIAHIEEAKNLRKQFERLGRDGISQRINDLVLGFAKQYPNGHYKEGIMLAGRLHALFLATPPIDYWREVAQRGYRAETYDLEKFEKRDEGQE